MSCFVVGAGARRRRRTHNTARPRVAFAALPLPLLQRAACGQPSLAAACPSCRSRASPARWTTWSTSRGRRSTASTRPGGWPRGRRRRGARLCRCSASKARSARPPPHQQQQLIANAVSVWAHFCLGCTMTAAVPRPQPGAPPLTHSHHRTRSQPINAIVPHDVPALVYNTRYYGARRTWAMAALCA